MRKGQFRKHLKERRCVIPCEGFYESRDEGGKQPYYFSRKDGKPLMLAGIWEIAEYKGDSRVAFATLTDQPNELGRRCAGHCAFRSVGRTTRADKFSEDLAIRANNGVRTSADASRRRRPRALRAGSPGRTGRVCGSCGPGGFRPGLARRGNPI